MMPVRSVCYFCALEALFYTHTHTQSHCRKPNFETRDAGKEEIQNRNPHLFNLVINRSKEAASFTNI